MNEYPNFTGLLTGGRKRQFCWSSDIKNDSLKSEFNTVKMLNVTFRNMNDINLT